MGTENAAVLIVDAQIAMFEGDTPPYAAESLLQALKHVIDGARAAEVPVVYVQHISSGMENMKLGMPGFSTHPQIAPLDGEPIVHKHASDSFDDTELLSLLNELGVKTIILGGLQTELCIDSTARGALSHGFNVIAVSDGHSTWESAGLTASQIVELHNASWPEIAHPHRVITVLKSTEILFS
jgi:nicotinamidase-related amidase